MMTSPPSAIAGSILYIPFAAVHMSAYIDGMTETTRSNGESTQTTCRRDDRAGGFAPRRVQIAAEHAGDAVVVGHERAPATRACRETRPRDR